ncbi:type II toxin-antitoxin system RelE/ParE family toxin [Reichenbachiella agarivorans]|uniref:Type II toxin-antitoxin system RelE/ParE family toxin n=1 Tax=Reichenbachiella agarivorans TaxID=2979464 RepID=A0ABY6CTB5_9BACT|nr:type II toxin-antitoxin system RelE/ParE family toxin [Reichenbachiella agarivorans]UXP33104.1 type II toxin-antitoxin system RelE/ParE family toxin [Reichenbachiella agarivorans]
MEKKIVWNTRPSKSFASALKNISLESYQNAELVEAAVLSAIEGIQEQPERYPPDKFKSENKGDHRAFETHSYRVAYRVTDTQIRILRIRHVKQEPKPY